MMKPISIGWPAKNELSDSLSQRVNPFWGFVWEHRLKLPVHGRPECTPNNEKEIGWVPIPGGGKRKCSALKLAENAMVFQTWHGETWFTWRCWRNRESLWLSAKSGVSGWETVRDWPASFSPWNQRGLLPRRLFENCADELGLHPYVAIRKWNTIQPVLPNIRAQSANEHSSLDYYTTEIK